MPIEALSFFVRTKQGQDIKMRRLGVREDQNDLYSLSWVQNVQEIRFDGRYPVAELEYVDETLPVEITALAFSPLVPHDSQTSGTPGFHIEFNLHNQSGKSVEVSLLSMLRNPVAWNLPDRKLVNSISHDRDTTLLTMRTSASGPKMSSIGSLSLSVTEGTASTIQADTEDYLGNGGWRRTQYGNCHESLFREFVEDGQLPSFVAPAEAYKKLPKTDEEIDALEKLGLSDLATEMRKYASLDAFARKLLRVDLKHFDKPEGLRGFLKVCRDRLIGEKGDELPNEWNNSALCSMVKLKPGESTTVRFTLSWYFPHHFSERGPEMGHVYENWFTDSEEVNRFLAPTTSITRRRC